MAPDRSVGDFGGKLRDARERRGISLRQIANRTKISAAALEALERNDISRLPGGIFSRAFVRSYASEVGLDPEATIQEFIAQFPQDSVTAGHSRSDQAEDTELFESDRRVASSVLWMILVSVPLAGLVLYFSMWRGRAEEPAGVDTGAAAPAAPAATAAAAPVATAAEAVSAPASAPPSAAAAESTVSTAPASTSSPAPASPPAQPRGEDRLTIVLSARRPVFVSATADGKKAIGRLLQTGERETV